MNIKEELTNEVEVTADAVNVEVRFGADGFDDANEVFFTTEVEMSTAFVFTLGVLNNSGMTGTLPSPDPAFISNARVALPRWHGPGTTFQVTYTENVPFLPPAPRVHMHVTGGLTASINPPTSSLYAQVIIEQFVPEEFPIIVRMYHGGSNGVTFAELTAHDNGVFEVESPTPNLPLFAIDVTPARYIDDEVQVNAQGQNVAHQFPNLVAATRRIRVILDQSVIDPPK